MVDGAPPPPGWLEHLSVWGHEECGFEPWQKQLLYRDIEQVLHSPGPLRGEQGADAQGPGDF